MLSAAIDSLHDRGLFEGIDVVTESLEVHAGEPAVHGRRHRLSQHGQDVTRPANQKSRRWLCARHQLFHLGTKARNAAIMFLLDPLKASHFADSRCRSRSAQARRSGAAPPLIVPKFNGDLGD